MKSYCSSFLLLLSWFFATQYYYSFKPLFAAEQKLLLLGCRETTVETDNPEPGSPGGITIDERTKPCIKSVVSQEIVNEAKVISNITVRGLSISKETQTQIKSFINQQLSPDILEKVLLAVRDDIREYDVIDVNSSAFSITYLLVNTKTDTVNDNNTQVTTVELIVDPYSINVTLLRRGENLIPYPRLITPKGSFDRKGKILRAFPSLIAESSDNYGPSLAIETNFTFEPKPESSLGDSSQIKRFLPFDANFKYKKSLTKAFYDVEANASIDLLNKQEDGSLTLSADFINSVNPLSINRTDTTSVFAGLEFSKQYRDASFIDDLAIRASGFHSNVTSELETKNLSNKESGLNLFVGAQSVFPSGRLYAGVWYSYAGVNSFSDYSKVSGIASLHSDLGSSYLSPSIEGRAGGGYASRDTPGYSLYYGGVDTSSLYNSYDYLKNYTSFPAGPFLPSFGNRDAVPGETNPQGLGGNVFANLGFTLAIPIPGLTKPLIPRIAPDPSAPDLKIGDMMRNQFNSNYYRSIATSMLVGSGSSLEQAKKEVDMVWKEANPIIDYLVDKAVLYSIRPIVLSDVAYLSNTNLGLSTTWASVGGGLQFKLVNLTAEVGYAQTVSPSAFNDQGNFFARLRIDQFNFF